jgi:DnaK suppressor protein
MTHDQLFVFRRTLAALGEQIRNKNRLTTQAISESYHSCPDQNDRASLESMRHMLIILGERERNLIRQIKAALSRLDEGTYGICEECGEQIPLKRLEAQPTSLMCVDCQECLENVGASRKEAWA